MKKFRRIFYCLLVVVMMSLCLTFTVACKNTPKEEDETPVYTLDDVVFNDATFEYDGKSHRIECDHLPEGATVSYSNNNQVEPGVYTVVATIKTQDNKRKLLSAKLTIEFIASTLSAPAEQTAVAYMDTARYSYTLNNTEQSVSAIVRKDGKEVSYNQIFMPGVYELELYAPQSTHYKESNHVNVKLTVKESQVGVSYKNAVVIADGNSHSLELEGQLPSGYTVTYKNNTGTTKGKYYAEAIINDEKGNFVETHRATLTIDNPDDAAFEAYLDEFFVSYLEGDQLSVNIFCNNPADFGLERYDASWYTYSSFTEEDRLESISTFETLLSELHAYDSSSLSYRQDIAYQQILDFLNYENAYYAIKDILFKENLYIDQFGGYVADFGTYMEAYTLREKADVDDIVNYLESSKEAFKSYVDYLKDKTEKGYGLSDDTLNAMIDYLEEVLESQSEDGSSHYYLQDVLCDKIDAVEFLTETEKTGYKANVAEKIANYFIVGVKELKDGIEAYLGTLPEDKEGYWATYEDGADLFKLELERLLGMEIEPTEYIRELNQTLVFANMQSGNALQTLIDKYNIKSNAQLSSLLASTTIYNGTPEEMLDYLKTFAETVVPTLETTPNIVVKNMDLASAKVSNAVAYYMKSALDNDKLEFITLNPVKLGDKNDVLGTLSHEGYPGHLYAYVYSKQLNLHNISKIMTNTAHGEGWATYVELKLYEYAIASSTNQKFIDVMNYLYYNQLSGFLFETRTDAGIHFENWGVNDVAALMDTLGYDSSQAEDVYNLLIETPASYASYGYGKLFFVSLHEEAQEVLGDIYDEVEFNAMLLSKGWTSLSELKNTFEDYMKSKCHQFGISYTA